MVWWAPKEVPSCLGPLSVFVVIAEIYECVCGLKPVHWIMKGNDGLEKAW